MTIKSALYTFSPTFLHFFFQRIENSPLGSRLAKGVFWSMIGAVISRGMMFIAFISVARLLGKTAYGELGMIQSTVGTCGIFAGFGLGLTATKHVAELRKSDPVRAGRIIGLSGLVAITTGGLMSLGLYIFAPWLSEHTINAPHLVGALQISAVMLFFTALNGAQTGALAGFEAFKTIANVNLMVGLISFPVLVAGAYFGGLTGVVWALAINLGFNWLLNHLALRREARKYGVPFTFKKCAHELSVLWRFSLPLVLSGVVSGPTIWASNALLVNQPGGYGDMGVYNAIMLVKQVPELVMGILMAPILPMLSEYFGKGDTKSYNKTISYAFALSLCVIVPASLMQAAVPSLTLLPYGQDYKGYANTVQWLMFHSVLIGIFLPFSNILVSMGRMWFGFNYNLTWGIAFFVLAYLLIPRYGATGLAAAFSVAYFLTGLPCVYYICRWEKAFVADVPLLRLTFLTLLSYGVCLLTKHFTSQLVALMVGLAVTALFCSAAFRLAMKSRVV